MSSSILLKVIGQAENWPYFLHCSTKEETSLLTSKMENASESHSVMLSSPQSIAGRPNKDSDGKQTRV